VGFQHLSASRLHMLAVDVAEGEAEGADEVCGGLGTPHGLCHLSWVVSEVVSWQGGGVTYLGSPTLVVGVGWHLRRFCSVRGSVGAGVRRPFTSAGRRRRRERGGGGRPD